MSALAIRHARSEDAAAIAHLAAQLGYPASEQDILRRLRKMLDTPTQAVFVACDDDGRVLGYVATEQRLMLETGALVEIVALAVDAKLRRGGTGRALVSAAELWAFKRGVKNLRVRSNIQREDAHAFYPGIGYQLEKTQHCYLRELN
ncbi:GNAT family N-acetyltransferase [Lysobacteraceae bacterium NML08-0793]|nr:GNAT family N-acetyltransferase [Xanthomonadaceae bacterium NML08-0793]